MIKFKNIFFTSLLSCAIGFFISLILPSVGGAMLFFGVFLANCTLISLIVGKLFIHIKKGLLLRLNSNFSARAWRMRM